MKFRIRSGYVYIREAIKANTRRGEQIVTPARRVEAGQLVDLTGEEALCYLAMLEPADKDASRFLESKVRPLSGPPQTP